MVSPRIDKSSDSKTFAPKPISDQTSDSLPKRPKKFLFCVNCPPSRDEPTLARKYVPPKSTAGAAYATDEAMVATATHAASIVNFFINFFLS